MGPGTRKHMRQWCLECFKQQIFTRMLHDIVGSSCGLWSWFRVSIAVGRPKECTCETLLPEAAGLDAGAFPFRGLMLWWFLVRVGYGGFSIFFSCPRVSGDVQLLPKLPGKIEGIPKQLGADWVIGWLPQMHIVVASCAIFPTWKIQNLLLTLWNENKDKHIYIYKNLTHVRCWNVPWKKRSNDRTVATGRCHWTTWNCQSCWQRCEARVHPFIIWKK